MENVMVATPTNEVMSYWQERGLGKNNLSDIRNASVLIVPEENFRAKVPFAFYQGTTDLLRYLKTEMHGQAAVEICADDEEYLELAIHGATFRISKIVVAYAVAPLLVGLLTNYLYDRLKAKPTDAVEASIVVEDHECHGFRFDFKGSAAEFSSLTAAVGELAKKCMASKQSAANHRKK